MKLSTFAKFEIKFGPFTEFVGAERSLATRLSEPSAQMLWLHTSHDTVASTLRLIGERMSADPTNCAHGLVVVPADPTATWWKLTRHFVEVASFPIGSSHLEANRLGSWEGVKSTRESVVFLFPRLAAGPPLPLAGLVDLHSYKLMGREDGVFTLPIVAGTRLYSPIRLRWEQRTEMAKSAFGPPAGCFYLLMHDWDGKGDPQCAWLRAAAGKKADKDLYYLDRRSYAKGRKLFSADASALWVVDSHVSRTVVRKTGASVFRCEAGKLEQTIEAITKHAAETIASQPDFLAAWVDRGVAKADALLTNRQALTQSIVARHTAYNVALAAKNAAVTAAHVARCMAAAEEKRVAAEASSAGVSDGELCVDVSAEEMSDGSSVSAASGTSFLAKLATMSSTTSWLECSCGWKIAQFRFFAIRTLRSVDVYYNGLEPIPRTPAGGTTVPSPTSAACSFVRSAR